MKQLADQPFALLGINSDSDREELKQTLQDEQITWRSWWDQGSSNGPIQTRWNVTLRPTIFILDGNGVIRYKDVTIEALDDAIATLLKELAGQPNKKAGADKNTDADKKTGADKK